ncbi:MAG: tRNA lysidine(34) synthetase TilS [Clostridia bacterium]|nr:tRNA lysidine(34) synthetase TilS [Clostridia bacterium]
MKLIDGIAVSIRESALRNRIQDPVLVGLSGGADSVALLCALARSRENGMHISAVHVDHGLRESSANDAAFCRKLCRELDVPLKVIRVSVPGEGSVEAAAREARYNAFHDAMKELNADTLVLAHHADDQAETVLMHLLYGTGTGGLSGMREYKTPVWRPLLGYRHAELETALQEIGQAWCEDETNSDTAYTRNYIRHCVMPQIEKAYPQAVRSISRTANVLQCEDDWIQQQADEWLAVHGSKGAFHFIEMPAFVTLHTALQRRILLTYASLLGLHLEFSHVEKLRNAVRNRKKVNLPGGWHASAGSERMHFIPPFRGKVSWDKSAVRTEPLADNFGDGLLMQAAPAGILERAVIRTRRAGDRITPYGMTGSMKLKDYFISRGVEQPFRDGWPLLCEGSEVLWVIGVGASQLLDVKDSDRAVMLHFIEKLPDSL